MRLFPDKYAARFHQKVIRAILAMGLLLFFHAAASAEPPQGALAEAQRAYLRGEFGTAKEKFMQVLEADPGNLAAKNYLRMIAVQENGIGGGQLESQLKSLILPKIELREATFGAALDFLKQQAAKQSEGKIAVNFVVQLPPEVLQTQKVTLSLASIPFTEALHYLCELANAEFRIEKYAVVVRPKSKAP